MSTETAIEWADYTWNLIWGCTKVSPGCDHCYIESTPPFRMAGMKFDRPGIGGNIPLLFHENRMYDPIRKRKPGKWFVNSLSDMFHDDVPAEFIARAFAAMRLADHHIFQLLTKRHGRMKSLLSSGDFREMVSDATNAIVADPTAPLSKAARYAAAARPVPWEWPIPNLWLGVTVENQDLANRRIPALLMTPAAVRFLSCEPLLSAVDLTRVVWPPRQRVYVAPVGTAIPTGPLGPEWSKVGDAHTVLDVLNGRHGVPGVWTGPAKKIDWVIAGGESGRGARAMHPDWARSLRDQCADAGVPFLFKQWGEWAPDNGAVVPEDVYLGRDGAGAVYAHRDRDGIEHMYRYGKKAAGRLLDGREWNQYPQEAAV